MLRISFLISALFFVFLHCDVGPGTSGRDHCKNQKDFPSFEGRIDTSIADKSNCVNTLPFLLQIPASSEDGREVTDYFLLSCMKNFKKLKECDNESELPYPIPFKP
ncbi:hypothetical protein EHQ58_00185 [Leptospira ognonensis]|uniref:Uncharacterized protein n=1 Tax=Leptospira ognonensis TaxID=2484945 RepID=A0A4R9KF16_9LEPT|nr:hypothetical protein [Leptospira ognonensis]TGL63823.1 hypothetical protein EHQ58_00185 [Leptospira ognonensis]